MTGIHKLTVSVLALVGAALLGPGAAQACGMFNCSATAAVLQPIEQNAERILFELNDDGTVTAIVEIAYTGDPQDFSWVVPVPEAPELDVVPPSTLLLLDDATAPVLTSQPTRCRERGYGCSVAGSSGVLLGCADSAIYGGERGLADYDGGVEVITYPQVGPYLSEYVSADDPAALITWLNENGYLLTEEMEPFVATYVAQGMGFLAMKLAGDTDTSSVAPISMRYPAENPSIPLVLTSVSAEPDMGVMVFVAGSQRYQSANWSNILVDPQDVQAQPWTGGTNYYPLVSYLVDKVGGRAFVTEYSGDLDTTSSIASTRWSGAGSYSTELDWLAGLNSRHTTLTRMYTRISGWEMSSDPIFEPS